MSPIIKTLSILCVVGTIVYAIYGVRTSNIIHILGAALAAIASTCILLYGLHTPKVYNIPNSYFAFTGSDISEAVESCLGLGDDYCTSAQETPDGMQLGLTIDQRNNLILRNNDFIEGLKKAFESSNSQYQCILDKSYQKLTLYFDENLSSDTQAKTILGIVSSYGMNYMLTNKTTDWNVKIEIFNCHTGKLVASANIPDEEITYGAKEWQKSYN